MLATNPPARMLLLGLIVDQLVDAVLTVTPDQQIVVANQATAHLFGYSHGELIGMSLPDLMPERFRHLHRKGVDAFLKAGGVRQTTEGYIDVLGLTKDGKEIPLSLSMTCMLHDGTPYLTGVLRDMSALAHAKDTIRRQLEDLRTANDLLQQLADVDHLTGVLNRRALQRLLPQLWEQSHPTTSPMAVLLCDIDFFKQYNDTYGHLEGDRCLISVAKALKDALGEEAVVARFGGEEFIALLKPKSPFNAQVAAERIRHAVHRLEIPHSSSTVHSKVSISVGIAVHDALIQSAEALIRHADDALYMAKRSRNTCVVWDPRLLGR